MGLFRSTIILIGLLVFCIPEIHSQTHLRLLDPGRSSITLPFSISQNLIILPVLVNGTQLNLVLDSGISSTIITELTGIDTLPLNYLKVINLNGLGEGKAGTAYSSTGNELMIELPDRQNTGILATNLDIYVLTDNQFQLSSQLGMPVHGLFGAEFFENFVISIDYESREISFHDPDQFTLNWRLKRFHEIPVNMVAKKAYVPAKLIQEKHGPVDLNLLIDTGASLATWIADFSNQNIHIPQKTVPAMLGQGLNGDIMGVNARVKGFVFGGIRFENVIVAYPDSSSVSGMMRTAERNGSLGNEILRRFEIVFDFPHQRILVKPNKWRYDAFSYNVSGMEVEKPIPSLPIFTVYSVAEESPASIAGIKTGDQIEQINYESTVMLTLDDINSVLHGHEGHRIRLRVLRNGEIHNFKFRIDPKI